MDPALSSLTPKERETLALLHQGYDAKSIARQLGLSVHTINERLRDARRKLGVSSSREAARMLAQNTPTKADATGYESDGDKPLGVSNSHQDMLIAPYQAPRRHSAGSRLAWFGGGMLIMSLVVAALVLVPLMQHGNASSTPIVAAAQTASAAPASLGAARAWLALIDGAKWPESWSTASSVFRTRISAADWAAKIAPLRGQFGAVRSRAYLDVIRSDTLPGAPAGHYEVLRFRTDFDQRAESIETVVLAKENGSWRAAGYFIK